MSAKMCCIAAKELLEVPKESEDSSDNEDEDEEVANAYV
jgi:hypothetical protein